ncbi:beta-propeller fold lactonase family protein [Cellulomonas sp. KH9]|uniref:lactonase family protein n=1 Tax=Cellulomonas sp. KH9 TaxID=1855324 RepID=UPI0008E1B271|nr:beta-propeller fold lactonase family protein [Cellulomonas sp. KH9]SFK16602.1 6-phosphogluconolactonase, cycloisomerase 2 family [Cellulomonas sp. KH9]
MSATTPLWIGTFPHAGIGTEAGLGEGVWRVDLDPATGALGAPRLVVQAPAPTFVATHPGGRWLYAVGESDPGSVTAFEVDDDGGLTARGTVASGGVAPCHLLVVDDALYVANYVDGVLGVVPLTSDGAFTPDAVASGRPAQVLGHTGSGPDADRQEGPHAHFAALTPDRRHVLVADLGTDELRRYARAADGRLAPDGVAATLPPGTGPRHVTFAADGSRLYVVGELDAAVHVLDWHAGSATGTELQRVPAVPESETADGVRRSPSHVLLDGDRLLLGVRALGLRGPDAVSTFDVRPGGTLGAPVTHPLGGATPRHLAVVHGWTVVALQDAHALVVHDAHGAQVSRVELPSPACVVPVAPAGARA